MATDSIVEKPAGGLVIAGWIVLGLTLVVPIFALVSFIMGIVLLAKDRYGQGSVILVLSPVVGILSMLFWFERAF